MHRPLPEDNIGEYLTAFVDGELDAKGMLLVLDHLSAHPESIRLIWDQQMLRLAAQRMVQGETPLPSRALRERVAELVTTAKRENASRARPWMPRVRWPLYFVGLLLLIAGGLAGRYLSQPTPPVPGSELTPRHAELHPSW